MSDGMRGSNRGFTLLELIIVIFLITLITGLSAIFFANTLPSGKFNAFVREFSAVIKHARALSGINNEDQVVRIDLDSKRYGIEGRDFRSIPADMNIKINDPVSGEVIKGEYRFVFHASGGIEGGTVLLWNNKKAVQILIDPVVGSVVTR